jgi:hypothetical protein
VRIYKPRHRLAAELEDLAAGVMGSQGTAVADPGSGSIVLKGPADVISQAVGVLASLDVPLRSFQIESRVLDEHELERLGLAVDGWVDLGSVRIGRGTPGRGLELRAGSGSGSSSQYTHSLVAVRDGGSADVWTGRLEPETVTVLDERGRPTRVLVGQSRSIRSGLRVEPRGLPDGAVELWIQPIVAHDRLDAPVEETGASSQVRVQPGEWLLLAESGRSVETRASGLLGRGETARDSHQVLMVRVLDRASPPAGSDRRP